MAKRILSSVAALFVAFVGVVLFYIVFTNAVFYIPGEAYARLIAAVLLLAFSIYVFYRRARWPAALLLVGSVAVAAYEIHEAFVFYVLDNHMDWIQRHQWFWPTDTENPLVLNALSYLLYPMLCLPIAWFWYSFEATQRHLTKR